MDGYSRNKNYFVYFRNISITSSIWGVEIDNLHSLNHGDFWDQFDAINKEFSTRVSHLQPQHQICSCQEEFLIHNGQKICNPHLSSSVC